MGYDPDAFRAESRRSWGSVAEGWARHGPEHLQAAMPVTAWMLDAARLQPGAEVLELAAGPGEVGFMALELIQPGGSLIVSDFAPEMLAEAQRRAEALGLRDVRFKQIDAESIDWPAATLDAVLWRWGPMLVADPGAALRECRRVLKPGGRLVVAAWAGPDENPWSSVVGDVLRARGHMDPSPPDQPGQWAWARPGVAEAALLDAGFVDEVEVGAVDLTYRETFDAWWGRTLAMSRSGRVISGLPDDEQAAAREDLRAALAPYEGLDGVLALPARTWVAAATA